MRITVGYTCLSGYDDVTHSLYSASRVHCMMCMYVLRREPLQKFPKGLFFVSYDIIFFTSNNKERFTLKPVQEKELRSLLLFLLPLLVLLQSSSSSLALSLATLCHGSTCAMSQASVTSLVSLSERTCSAQFVAGILLI